MNRRIAILRGINVGGKRKILMNDLKSLCQQLGWKHVETYIQSGNVIFESDYPGVELEMALEQAIKEHYGFDVPVIVRTSKEIKALADNNPFNGKESDITQLHLTFLKETPSNECVKKLNAYNVHPDRIQVVEKDVYMQCLGKYHQSKLTNNFFEKNLKVGATTRNWKTVLKLKELSE
ncbi:MAG: DUF1697 domain-containing protein [Bacteroidales bacterium]|nr:DUF1697 domain-containing protein [Bacteroidales bacterium]